MTRSRMPLEGVRVADFTWVGAGSFTTKLLADHGADVIKVESRAKPDGIRLSPPFKDGISGVNRSGYFADRNTSKRSLALNLKTDDGQRLARRLVAESDIVANNFTPGVMDRLGLGWSDVQRINPRVIYLAMSMQGSTGPARDHLGYGLTIGSLVGLQHLTGLPEREPVGTGTNYPDHIPNPAHGAFAVLAALRHRRRTGEGQCIDLAQTEPTIAVLGEAVLDSSTNGRSPGRSGNSHPRYAPHGVYGCAGDDDWIAIAVTNEAQWQHLVEVLGLDAPREWKDASARKADERSLDVAVAEQVAAWDVQQLAAKLRAVGVPAGKVNSSQDVVEDSQLSARGHWVRLDHPEMGPTLYSAPAFRLSRTPGGLRRPAPCLGEHTDEICRTILGLDDDEIARLQDRKVLW